ncbi:hypothetical protein D3C87_1882550 [compost metagenome]
MFRLSHLSGQLSGFLVRTERIHHRENFEIIRNNWRVGVGEVFQREVDDSSFRTCCHRVMNTLDDSVEVDRLSRGDYDEVMTRLLVSRNVDKVRPVTVTSFHLFPLK